MKDTKEHILGQDGLAQGDPTQFVNIQLDTDVDKPYFEAIADNIKKDARWYFYVHDKDKNTSVEKYAKSVVVEEQTFVITNESLKKID